MAKRKMRQPGICSRKRNGKTTYFCDIGGKQHGLGTGREAAELEFADLLKRYRAKAELTDQIQPKAGAKPNAALTVQAVLFAFLDWVSKNRAPKTYDFYKYTLVGHKTKAFADFIGDLTVAEFGAHHVEDWISGHFAGTSDNYRRILIRCVQAAFNWSVKRGTIPKNPLTGLEKPASQARETYVDAEQWEAILGEVDDEFRDFLLVLRETGCRPLEARVVSAENFDREGRRFFWADPPKKVPGRKHPRIVLLNDAAFELCQKLALKNPEGPLFRNPAGGPWTKDGIVSRCLRLSKVLGFSFSAYSLRHSFCTDALVRGVDPLSVAHLMGHRDASMVMKVYNQLGSRDEHLRQALLKATG